MAKQKTLRGRCGARARKVKGGWHLFTSTGYRMPYPASAFRTLTEAKTALREVCASGYPRMSKSSQRAHDASVSRGRPKRAESGFGPRAW